MLAEARKPALHTRALVLLFTRYADIDLTLFPSPTSFASFSPSILVRRKMTLTTTEQVSAAGEGSKPQFLIFFSSGSPPWCPDCVDALPHIRNVFETDPKTNGAEAHLVLVGQRAE